MAVGTNGFVLNRRKLEEILPHLTYLRINISAGERSRYAQIMASRKSVRPGLPKHRDMVAIKREKNLAVTSPAMV